MKPHIAHLGINVCLLSKAHILVSHWEIRYWKGNLWLGLCFPPTDNLNVMLVFHTCLLLWMELLADTMFFVFYSF